MTPDPIILLIASITFFIGGLAKGAMGFGLPLLAIPMLTIFGSLPLALSITAPPVIATNIWQIWKYRTHRDVPFLRGFLIAGGLGLVLGTFWLRRIEDAYLEIALGTLVLFYLLVRHRKGSSALPSRIRDRIAPITGVLAGFVHGTTGMSGLVATPYFHASGLARPAFIFCNSIMFTTFAALHLPTLTAVGLYEPSAMAVGAVIIAPAFAGLWLGERIGETLSATLFPVLVQIMLAMAATLSIWNGVGYLFASS